MFFTFTSFHLLPIYPHFLSSSSIPVLTYSDVKNIDKSQLLHFPSIQFSFILYFSQWSDSLVETPYKWSCIAGRQKVGKLQHIYNMKKHILSLNFCVNARPCCGYWESVNFIFFHALISYHMSLNYWLSWNHNWARYHFPPTGGREAHPWPERKYLSVIMHYICTKWTRMRLISVSWGAIRRENNAHKYL